MVPEIWVVGGAYEAYVGRWSRQVGQAFVQWLNPPGGGRWLDVGCGTGALTSAVLAAAEPVEILGLDPAEGFLTSARADIADPRATFAIGQAQSLPLPDRCLDVVVSGLTLNFVPDPQQAVAEFCRVTVPGGTVAAYVWDYANGMAMIRHFWDAAAALDPDAAGLDEGRRFPLCRPENLEALWTDTGLGRVVVQSLEIPMRFADFDDYWVPFLGGQGPAPAYAMSLAIDHRAVLRDLLRVRMPVNADGSITLTARAWAIRGTATS